MANYEATRYAINGSNLTGIEGVNTGLIVPWGSASIPSGFLECNGQSVSQATYAALFAVIGTTYGNPGGGNFNVPDLTDRTVVNKSNTKNLAQTGGANTFASTGNVSQVSLANTTLTTAQIPSHLHTSRLIQLYGDINQNIPLMTRQSTPGTSGSTGGDGAHSHNLTGNFTFTGNSTSVLQPYLVLIYIIKT